MIWVATFIIGMILGAVIMFIGIAIGRQMGEAEAMHSIIPGKDGDGHRH